MTDASRRELDMVFTFEHVDLDVRPGGAKWDVVALHLPVLKRTLARWQEGLADVGWNSLYWSNHDQPRAVTRFGDDRPEHRVASAKTLATVLHLHRGTPYVYQGEELGMTNAPLTDIVEYRDIESLQPPRPGRRQRCSARDRHDGAGPQESRPRQDADAVGRRDGMPGSRPASRGCP